MNKTDAAKDVVFIIEGEAYHIGDKVKYRFHDDDPDVVRVGEIHFSIVNHQLMPSFNIDGMFVLGFDDKLLGKCKMG